MLYSASLSPIAKSLVPSSKEPRGESLGRSLLKPDVRPGCRLLWSAKPFHFPRGEWQYLTSLNALEIGLRIIYTVLLTCLSFFGQVFTSLHVHDLLVDCGDASTISITVAT